MYSHPSPHLNSVAVSGGYWGKTGSYKERNGLQLPLEDVISESATTQEQEMVRQLLFLGRGEREGGACGWSKKGIYGIVRGNKSLTY